MSETLRELRGELLSAEIRKTLAEAEAAELRLASQRDTERDRLAKPGFNRVLNVFGPIMGAEVDAYIGALGHWERRDPGESIQININSPGGSVLDGLALYDTIQRLRRKGHHVTTRAVGLAASMGVILLQAGDERIADSNAQILVHELAGGTMGKISGIRDEAAFYERLNDRLFSILQERSKLTKRKIQTHAARREWWMDADEALKHGFVDRVE